MRLQATQEGLVPLKTWIKSALDQVIQVCMGEPDLEFAWAGDDAMLGDPRNGAGFWVLEQKENIFLTAYAGRARSLSE